MSSQSPISQLPQVPGSPPREPFKRPDPDVVTPVETQIIGSHSSPVKPGKLLDKLVDIRDLPDAIDKSIDQSFTRDHLSDLTFPRQTWWSTRCGKLVETIRAIRAKRGREIDMYAPLCELLSYISEGIYCKLFVNSSVNPPSHHFATLASLEHASRPENPIIFINHHKNPPSRHPQNGVLTRPDILAVNGPPTAYTLCKDSTSVYEGVPWHRIVSCVEPKHVVNPRVQLSSYLWDHMTARPDMPGVYGLAARASGYEILWSDASGTIASPHFTWNSDSEPLVRYVYSLYVPPPNHFTRDPTIKATDGDDLTAAPFWTIRVRGKEYPNCRLLFFGPSWGRRTFVWASTVEGGTTVIKDAHRDDGRRFVKVDS